MKGIVFAFIFLLGCAAPMYKTTEVVVRIRLQSAEETQAVCRVLFGKNVIACAAVNYELTHNICTVYIEPEASRAILAHELLHCVMGQYH